MCPSFPLLTRGALRSFCLHTMVEGETVHTQTIIVSECCVCRGRHQFIVKYEFQAHLSTNVRCALLTAVVAIVHTYNSSSTGAWHPRCYYCTGGENRWLVRGAKPPPLIYDISLFFCLFGFERESEGTSLRDDQASKKPMK